ncbi:iron-containing redox enzyme family protein [Pengzhenrongella frigida]|uniref:Iron-containing redox enzyme family protein n=1 Tax=Pengzhenrongella frigida TaxID=1259133 RepID=A0A4Q5MYU2_9MICO|nr:iron-containing redox enzyme family protein [Cellulomonas sp. HLT2-17]RYV50849.1 iron-containing redox enzyme family protein [Cellulomonas sp. HLT2-17]
MPDARGEASAAVISALLSPSGSGDVGPAAAAVDAALRQCHDLLHDEDLQLALLVLYELHYQGLRGVDERWEWNPDLLKVRAQIEGAFEDTLRRHTQVPVGVGPHGEDVAGALFALAAKDTGPGLSAYIAKRATDQQLHELLIHRSVYQLKEADPHTWAIPRLAGAPKAALVEIQADEYGGGDPERMHSTLFGRTMRGLGLDDTYGAYVDLAPALTLASVNMMSMFGLHRRLRGAIAGHLAAFEMTSSIPNRLYGNGFRRHGYGEDVTWYFDEHVEADAVHEQIAGRDLAGKLAEQEPGLHDDVLFGAAACLYVDGLVGSWLVEHWQRDETSLRTTTRPAALVAR